MTNRMRASVIIAVVAALFVLVGTSQSWNSALGLVNLCLVSAIIALGVNLQWGYAGIFNVGIMGFAMLGGATVIWVAMPPVQGAWQAGGQGVTMTVLIWLAVLALAAWLLRRWRAGWGRRLAMLALLGVALWVGQRFLLPAIEAIEDVDPARTGYLGGAGLPVVLAWPLAGVVAALAAWGIGKVCLGLRSDFLAIATLGLSEIVRAFLLNEEWLTRGPKNVSSLPRPVPLELDLQQAPWFLDLVRRWHADALAAAEPEQVPLLLSQLANSAAGVTVKLCYMALFLAVLGLVFWLMQRLRHSPWGRMMRAIRDNETAAGAMGKDVARRHLQIFVLGSALVGVGGAMLTTLEGQFTPGSYIPLRHTFLIWVMVIVGGSGNNWGAVLGAFLVYFLWVQAEPAALTLVQWLSEIASLSPEVQQRLLEGAPYSRVMLVGLMLIVVLRYFPRGILPEARTH